RVGDDEHVLALTLHHLVCDGWSVGVLDRDLRELYGELAGLGPSRLPELGIRYLDHARRQRELDRNAPALERWRRLIRGTPTVLELPTDRQRPPVQSYRGGRVTRRLRSRAVRELEAYARSLGATPFAAHLSVFAALLARIT